MQNVKIEIRGRVQGVGFRYHTRKTANELDIKGYVKNLSDGSVYILASGKASELDKFINWCHIGPRLSVVESVKISVASENEMDDFHIR